MKRSNSAVSGGVPAAIDVSSFSDIWVPWVTGIYTTWARTLSWDLWYMSTTLFVASRSTLSPRGVHQSTLVWPAATTNWAMVGGVCYGESTMFGWGSVGVAAPAASDAAPGAVAPVRAADWGTKAASYDAD